MATSKLMAKSAKYGAKSRNDYVASAASHLYVGKRSSDSGTYHSRLTMPALSSISQIGANRVSVTGAKLWLYLNDSEGGATTITIVGSTSSAYNAAGVSTTFSCPAGTGVKSADITDIVEAMAEHNGDWYIHLRATGSVKRFDGTSRRTPNVTVDWEFVANTIKSSASSVTLGNPVTFTIAPETGDASFTLTANIGDTSATIAAKGTATSYAWTPPVSLASEITSAASGTVTIGMIVYDSAGNEKRREVLYQTVTVPTDTVKPTASAIQTTLSGGFNGGILTGETSILVSPVGGTANDYGADIASMTVNCVNGSKSMTLNWTAAEMTEEPLKFTGIAKTIPKSFCASAGNLLLTLTATDTRGITASTSTTLTVYAYSRPVIHSFSVDRYGPVYDANEQISGYQQDDVGDHVWVNLSASIYDVAGKNMLTWKITGSDGTSKTGMSGTVVNRTNDRSSFPSAVGAEASVEYTLTVTDTVGNTAQSYSQVTPGRANFSLAGSKYGVGVGCIARGTAANPLFKCDYPSEFSENVTIHGVLRTGLVNLTYIREYTLAASDYGEYFSPNTNQAWAAMLVRYGPFTILHGTFNVSGQPSGTGQAVAITLPKWAYPAVCFDTIQMSSVGTYWRARILADGVIYARAYDVNGNASTFTQGTQLSISAMWYSTARI